MPRVGVGGWRMRRWQGCLREYSVGGGGASGCGAGSVVDVGMFTDRPRTASAVGAALEASRRNDDAVRTPSRTGKDGLAGVPSRRHPHGTTEPSSSALVCFFARAVCVFCVFPTTGTLRRILPFCLAARRGAARPGLIAALLGSSGNTPGHSEAARIVGWSADPRQTANGRHLQTASGRSRTTTPPHHGARRRPQLLCCRCPLSFSAANASWLLLCELPAQPRPKLQRT